MAGGTPGHCRSAGRSRHGVGNFGQDGKMAEEELSDDPIAVSKKASVEIETVRRNLQRLYEELAITNDSAKEIARNELCKALVQRLELAEREAVELAEMITMARKL
jgi:hypothetical protein